MIQLVNETAIEDRKANADKLREYADKVEAGEITEFVLSANDKTDNCYAKFGFYGDRWRMIGALEDAKLSVISGEL